MIIQCYFINLLLNNKTINTFKRQAGSKMKLNFIFFKGN